MPSLFILRFKQGPFESTTHWGLFVGDRDKPSGQLPYSGTLFHASGDCLACVASCSRRITRTTSNQRLKTFCPTESHSLHSYLRLPNSNVSQARVGTACGAVTDGRNWNIVTANCQVWVVEVLKYLVEIGEIPNSVFESMRAERYITLPKRVAESSGSSGCCIIL
jgi:hypothetical protein